MRWKGPRRSSKSARRIGNADESLFETILLDVDAGDHVATITLNRPEQLNAFNRTMCEEMAQAWRMVKARRLRARRGAAGRR